MEILKDSIEKEKERATLAENTIIQKDMEIDKVIYHLEISLG